MRRHPLHVATPGTVVGKRGGRLEARREGTVVASAALLGVSELVLVGNVQVTTPALHALLDADVPVILLRGDGRTRGRLEPPASPHAQVRRAQLRATDDPQRRLMVAREIVAAKLGNQARLVTKQLDRNGAVSSGEGAARLRGLAVEAAQADSVARLRGLEGAGSRAYFAALRRVLAGWVPAFSQRDRQADDPVNALINYLSAVLRETVQRELVVRGLDPSVGFYHEPFRARPSLALDLMEEWRPVLLERTVLALIRRGQVGPGSLEPSDEGPRLSREARSAAVAHFDDRLQASYRPAGASRATPLAAVLAGQAAQIRDLVTGARTGYEGFRWH